MEPEYSTTPKMVLKIVLPEFYLPLKIGDWPTENLDSKKQQKGTLRIEA